MFIKQLKLEGFRGFEKLTLDFPFKEKDGEEKPVPVVLLGLNGAGKSSVLDAIVMNIEEFFYNARIIQRAYGTREVFEKDLNNKLGHYKIETNLKFEEGAIPFYLDSNLDNSKNIGELFKSYKDKRGLFTHFPTNRYIDVNTQNKSFNPNAFYSFKRRLIDFTAFLVWFERKENLENQEKVYKGELDLTLRELNVVRNGLELFLNKFGTPIYSKIRILRESKTTEFDEVKESTIEKESIFSIEVEVNLAIDKNGQTFKFSQLSHGEQMILLMVGDIARRLTIANPKMENPLEGKGIVLIDEIELHLHPNWQGKVVNALATTFPNIQFIVTTHSPLVINHVKRESIFMLESFQLQELNGFNNYGAEVEDVLLMVQKVESENIYPKDLMIKFKQYFKEIEEGELDKAKETKKLLETMTDFQHSEIMKGDSMIKLKELMKR